MNMCIRMMIFLYYCACLEWRSEVDVNMDAERKGCFKTTRH